jgi:hypothetical protein
MSKQKRKIFFTVGGNGTASDPGKLVSVRRFTKATANRKIKTANQHEA